MNKWRCTHEKEGAVYDKYRLTRTVCEGADSDGKALVEICDYCKTFIITITDYRGNITILEVEQE